MTDTSRTHQELLKENDALKRRIKKLEHADEERKRAEDALKSSEDMLRLITENMSDMVRVTDCHGINIYVSPSHFKGIGYTQEERKGKSGMDIVHPDDQGMVFNAYMEGLANKKPVKIEYRVKHADGRYIWLETMGDLLLDAQGNPKVAVMCSRDITDRKQAEAKLRQQTDAMEAASDGIAILNDAGEYVYLNQAHAAVYGYENAVELIGKTWRVLYDSDYLQRFDHEIMPEFGRKGVWNGEAVGMKKDGSKFPQELSLTAMDHGGLICVVRDITQRKQVEEENRWLMERLQRSEKMEALGTLAGGIAHDLNNVLGIVVGYAELVMHELDKSSQVKPHLLEIVKGGEKAAAIVQDMLTMTRSGVSSRRILNLNQVITDLQNSPEFKILCAYHFSVELKIDLEPNSLNISGSAVHIGKTLFNLASNGCEAMPNGGILTIRTANQYIDKPIQGYEEVREGDYVVLSVSDTGEGISAADLKRIFEPFYTKKIMGRSGTGLGLAVAWGTVKDHNGYINVQSEEDKGSTFSLYFPATREEVTSNQAAIPVADYMGRGEAILVVDDVQGQRDLATAMLRKLNYSVASVGSGEEAVTYLHEHAADLLVLDMIMDPGMDGLDTYRGVLKIHPKQKAIIVSGFSVTDRVSEAQALGAGAYVRKPYVLERLGLAVRKELDRR